MSEKIEEETGGRKGEGDPDSRRRMRECTDQFREVEEGGGR